MTKDINKMTRKEFEALPSRGWNDTNIKFNSFVLIPQATNHESGYKHIKVVACFDCKPICLLTSTCDSICINDNRLNESKVLNLHTVSIDCLPTSRLIRVFTNTNELLTEVDLSSLYITVSSKKLTK